MHLRQSNEGHFTIFITFLYSNKTKSKVLPWALCILNAHDSTSGNCLWIKYLLPTLHSTGLTGISIIKGIPSTKVQHHLPKNDISVQHIIVNIFCFFLLATSESLYKKSKTFTSSPLFIPTSTHKINVNTTSAPTAKYNGDNIRIDSVEYYFSSTELLLVALSLGVLIPKLFILIVLCSKSYFL